jgi:membrane protein implicated in regulation of membrane protease activity
LLWEGQGPVVFIAKLMSWSGWIILGLALLVGEVTLSASFFLLFFGLGAVCVGGLVALGVPLPLWGQWVAFPALSLALLALFRSKLCSKIGSSAQGTDTDSMVGVRGIAVEALAPGERGRGEFRGSSWEIHNVGLKGIGAGELCEVKSVRGLTLDVALC